VSSLASTGSSVQRFDQSERTITTEPDGMRPFRISQARMSATVAKYFGSRRTFGATLTTTSGRTA
jgi:hypothetical protein